MTIEKTRLWEQTETAFGLMRSVRLGGEAQATLAVNRLEEMLPAIIAPILRGRIIKIVRDFRNGQIIKSIKDQAS